MKYRKKPIVIDATQWMKHGDHASVIKYDAFDGICKECGHPYKDHGLCSTLEGTHIVCPGDWIITGIKGENYPCKPDIFKLTYDSVD